MQKMIDTKERLTHYSTFKETVLRIKKVVTQRAQNDFYGWIDFRTEHFDITNKYYLRRKILFQNNKRLERSLRGDYRDGIVR